MDEQHGGASRPFPTGAGRGPCAVTTETDVPATMRDGTVLRADVYRPKTTDAVPVILMRTQYGNRAAQAGSRYQPPDWFASHCYLVAIEDVRGQGASGGTFSEFTHEMEDGYDSVEWAAALRGSNGKVGMYGSSYVGATQWLAATAAPPHLATIVPANTASDYYDGWTYEGGEFRLAFVQPWAIGLATSAAQNRNDQATAAELKAAAADPTRWMDFRPLKDLPPMQPQNPAVAPCISTGSGTQPATTFGSSSASGIGIRRSRCRSSTSRVGTDAFWQAAPRTSQAWSPTVVPSSPATTSASLSARGITSTGVGLTSDPAPLLKDIGAVADSPINDLMLAWFGHFLKGENNDVAGKPRVDYFVMGANTWKSATSWPLPQTNWTTFYLSGPGGIADRKGQLVSTAPSAQPPDTYTYDPAFPVPSLGGHSCCGAQSGPQGPYDQTPVEQRSDVLVYSSAPLEHDTEMTGPVNVRLWAQSTSADTDFTAKLTVVKPDGQVINLNNGILRTSFRDSLSDPTPTMPGRPYEYQIHVWPTSYEFRAGDRIGLEISSSDYPQFAPNPNTGAPFGMDSATRTAVQTIVHDEDHPSAVTLPMIPADPSRSRRCRVLSGQTGFRTARSGAFYEPTSVTGGGPDGYRRQWSRHGAT